MAKRKALAALPDKLPPRSPLRNYAQFAEENFTPTGPGSRSLLRTVSQRFPKPLTAGSLLMLMVQERQGVYAALLGRVMSGWSLSSSSVVCGLSRETVKNWLAHGLNDQAENDDTYYARFASDIYGAMAYAVGDAESRVVARDPIEYLRSGPGKAFYRNERYWQVERVGDAPADDDINPLANYSGGDDSALSSDRMSSAIEILKASGVLSNPEFTRQLEQQHGTPPANNSGSVRDNTDQLRHDQREGADAVVECTGSVQIISSPDPAYDSGQMDRSMRTETKAEGDSASS